MYSFKHNGLYYEWRKELKNSIIFIYIENYREIIKCSIKDDTIKDFEINKLYDMIDEKTFVFNCDYITLYVDCDCINYIYFANTVRKTKKLKNYTVFDFNNTMYFKQEITFTSNTVQKIQTVDTIACWFRFYVSQSNHNIIKLSSSDKCFIVWGDKSVYNIWLPNSENISIEIINEINEETTITLIIDAYVN